MIRTALVLMLLALQGSSFKTFSYCRLTPNGSFDSMCILLSPAGAGEMKFKRTDGDDLKFDIQLNPWGTSQVQTLLAGTKYLANAANYESKRKVANIGRKHLILETASDRREADFNYSDMKDVTALVTFFEDLLTLEVLAVDLEWAMRFDRLGIPDRLDRMDKAMKAGKMADTKTLLDVLDAVIRDDKVLNYARTHAQTMRDRIAAGK